MASGSARRRFAGGISFSGGAGGNLAGSSRAAISSSIMRRAGSERRHFRAMEAKGSGIDSGTVGSAALARFHSGGYLVRTPKIVAPRDQISAAGAIEPYSVSGASQTVRVELD